MPKVNQSLILAATVDDSIENPPLNASNIPLKLTPKQEAYAILRRQGFNNSDVSKMLGFTPANGCLTDKKLKKQYDLTSPSQVKLAAKAHKKLIQGFLDPDNTKLPIELKGSDVNRCIDRVYDRAQPVRTEVQGPVNISFTQINIEEYK